MDFFGNTTGRYIPWREPGSQEKFRTDLTRMIEIALRDGAELARQGVAPDKAAPPSITAVPAFSLTDLAGRTVDETSLQGKVTVVEFWAEWCPPSQSTLAWLAETSSKLGDSVNVLGIAVKSEEANIRSIVESMNLPTRSLWVRRRSRLPSAILWPCPRSSGSIASGKP